MGDGEAWEEAALAHLPACETVSRPDLWFITEPLPPPFENVTAVSAGITEIRGRFRTRHRLEPATAVVCRDGHAHTISVRPARTPG